MKKINIQTLFSLNVFALCRQFLHELRLVVAPFECAACKDVIYKNSILCVRCSQMIHPVVTSMLTVTDTYQVKVYAVSDYQDPLRTLVLAKGYANPIAARDLGTIIWQSSGIAQTTFDYIIPIPLHWTRYAHRGFNQSYEIAYQLSKLSGKEIAQPLKRTKRTQFQAMLSLDKRPENIKNAFELTQQTDNTFTNKTFLVVDDVMTSGATLKEAIKQLRKLKPASIVVAVACRVV